MSKRLVISAVIASILVGVVSLHAQSVPADPLYKDSEALKSIGIEQAWKITKGDPKIVVAIIDSGADAKHEDLEGQFVEGWNVLAKNKDTKDEYGHGTKATGVIAARHNALGNAGIAPNCKVMPVKVTSGKGLVYADWKDVAAGIEWAADHGARIICVPLGSRVGSPELKKAVEHAHKKGCLIVAPVGNQVNIQGDYYPAYYEGVIPVMVEDGNMSLKPDALWGPRKVMTTAIGKNKYEEFQGSSCGAAAVAGILALAWSARPEMTADDLRRVLMRERDPIERVKTEGHDGTSKKRGVWREYLGWETSQIHAGRIVSGAKAPLTDLALADVLAPNGRLILNAEQQKIWEDHWILPLVDPDEMSRDPKNQVLRDADLIRVYPQRPKVGQETTIEVTVKNLGDTPTEPAKLTVEIEDRVLNKSVKEEKVSKLEAGGSQTFKIPWTATIVGTATVTARLEVKDQRPENNVVRREFQILDRQVEAAEFARFWMGEINEGQTEVDLNMVIRNTGALNGDFILLIEVGKKGGGGYKEYHKQLIKNVRIGDVTDRITVPLKWVSWMEGPDPWVSLAVYKSTSVEQKDLLNTTHVNRLLFQPLDFVRPQDVDTFGREDVIVDAPWQIVSGREHIPVLLYLPEVHWDGGDSKSGIVLKHFIIEMLDEQRTPKELLYTQSIFGDPKLGVKEGILVEDEEGNVLDWRPQSGDSKYVEEKRQWYQKYGLFGYHIALPDSPEAVIRESGWHRIILIPRKHFNKDRVVLRAKVSYVPLGIKGKVKPISLKPSENLYHFTKVLEVRLPKGDLPRFAPKDRYYDMHTHTMSEFTSVSTLLGARKNFGGPWRMIERAAYSIGMIDTYLRDVGNNKIINNTKDKLVTTDHNAFLADDDMPEAGMFFRRPVERDKADNTPQILEWNLLKQYFGLTAGQEVSLHKKAGKIGMLAKGQENAVSFLDSVLNHWLWNVVEKFAPNSAEEKQKMIADVRILLSEIYLEMGLAAHTLMYEHPHRLNGPWYGSVHAGVTRLPLNPRQGDKSYEQLRHIAEIFVEALVGNRKDNPNKIWSVMYKLVEHGGYTFGAHPAHGSGADHERLNWTEEMFQIGMNFDDRSRTRQPVKIDRDTVKLVGEKHFPVKGFQWWNAPAKRVMPIKDVSEFYTLDPFGRFVNNGGWHDEFARGTIKWMSLIRQGLRYTFTEEPRKVFLRKVYMIAGTDAHGDFNYTSDLGATIADVWLENQVNDNAYGKVRTYVAENARVEMGDAVCTDGPIMKWGIDSELRMTEGGKSPDWHGGWEKIEYRDKKWIVIKKDGTAVPLDPAAFQSDGRQGGEGTFDGGRTMLVAENARSAIHNRWINSAEFGGPLTNLELIREMADKPGPVAKDANGIQVRVADARIPVNVTGQPASGEEYWGIPPAQAITRANGVYILVGSTSKHRDNVYSNQCWTNPIWVSPVAVTVESKQGKNQDGKPAADFEILFDFQMTMSGGIVEAKRLNSSDESEGEPVRLPGLWYPRDTMDSARYRMNARPLVEKGHRRWFIYMKEPKDAYANVLNAVGTVIELPIAEEVVQKPVPPPPPPGNMPNPNPNPKQPDPVGKNVLDRMKERRAQDLDILRKLDGEILVIRGDFDHVERVLDGLGVSYDLAAPADLRKKDLTPYTAVFVNCFGTHGPKGGKIPVEAKDISEESRKNLGQYVAQGGYLFTSDWALVMLEAGLPGYLERLKHTNENRNEQVTAGPSDRAHPLLRDVFAFGQKKTESVEWMMEKESLTFRIDGSKVKVLMSSPELQQKHGTPFVAVAFEIKGTKKNPGTVLHVIGHFYQQGLGNKNDDEVAKMTQLIVNFLVEAKKSRTGNAKK